MNLDSVSNLATSQFYENKNYVERASDKKALAKFYLYFVLSLSVITLMGIIIFISKRLSSDDRL